MFVLTRSEQQLVVVVMIALVIGTWIKHHHDMQLSEVTIERPDAFPEPFGSPEPIETTPKEEAKPENPLDVGR